MKPAARETTTLPGGHAEGFAETFRELYRRVYRPSERRSARGAGLPDASLTVTGRTFSAKRSR